MGRHAAAPVLDRRPTGFPLRVSDLIAELEGGPAPVVNRPLRATDLIAELRGTPIGGSDLHGPKFGAADGVAVNVSRRLAPTVAVLTDTVLTDTVLADPATTGLEPVQRRASWLAAVPALVRPATTPVRIVLRRPMLTAAVVVAAAAATAATSIPTTASSAHAKHETRVAGVSASAESAQQRTKADASVLENRDSQTRVSRNKRSPLNHLAQSPMKPGQTVPGRWVLPAPGVMTTCFCMRWGVMHEGIDIAKGYGVPIRAVGDGLVIKAGPAEGFGNWVVIQHSNGDVSIYGHVESYSVHVGEKVKAGEIIAHEGSEGFSTGPHLHFEVHRGSFDGPPINPVPWLRARGIKIPGYDPNG